MQLFNFGNFFDNSDLTQIQTGIGDKCGAVIQALSTLVGGVIIAFVFGWKLALVMLALSPVIMAAGALTGKVMGALSNKEQTAYSEAGSVAEEAISSIRTVVAFGGEKDEMQRYNSRIKVELFKFIPSLDGEIIYYNFM